jgi:beta-N-acetylhexosaminidase
MTRVGLRVLAGQVLIAGFPGKDAPEELLRPCALGELGGIVLFKRNLGAMHEVSALSSRFAEAAPKEWPLLIAVDQEGGRVARLGPPVLKLPPMRALAELGDPDLTERAGRLLGQQLRALGFTMNLAPVLDVNTNPQNPVIGDRAFGDTPAQVIEQALAFARGLERPGGVLACGKHFPGHGDTSLDSHLALPRLSHARDRLEQIELAPFRAAEGELSAIMTAHVVFDAIARDTPATLAPAAIDGLLRRELGYQGVVLSDDLEMKAIADHYGIEQAACMAIEAGCDSLLVCSDLTLLERARRALAERARHDLPFAARLEQAAERAIALRKSCEPRPIVSPSALERALREDEARELSLEIAEHVTRLSR